MANFGIMHYASGGAYYYRLVRILDGYIWNNLTGAWAETVTWANSMITITEKAGMGDYPFVIPTTMVAGGRCNLIVYTNVGAAVSDAIKEEHEINIGSINGF